MSNFIETFPTGADNAPIPNNLLALVDAELNDREKIQWIDQPIPVFFSVGAVAIILFAITWTAFSIFWMCGASGVFDLNKGQFEFNGLERERLIFAAFGIPFLLIGLVMLSTPWWGRRSMKRTIYVITDLRAIIFQGTPFAHGITSFYPADITHLYRKQKANGMGDICLCKKHFESGNSSDEGFENIRNVQEVEQLIRELKETKERT